jgi:DNA (cytosine-5)-methyltransferase 1
VRYGSLFSGIEASSLAFEELGWTPQWFAEIDPFCCRVLSHHWSTIPNLGDINNPNFCKNTSSVDLIIGGSPCQSFSLSGGRKGLGDTRGLLTLRYFEIINELKPRWFVWENVPGLLSSNNGKDFNVPGLLSSNNGKDFKVVLNEMVKYGYGIC